MLGLLRPCRTVHSPGNCSESELLATVWPSFLQAEASGLSLRSARLRSTLRHEPPSLKGHARMAERRRLAMDLLPVEAKFVARRPNKTLQSCIFACGPLLGLHSRTCKVRAQRVRRRRPCMTRARFRVEGKPPIPIPLPCLKLGRTCWNGTRSCANQETMARIRDALRVGFRSVRVRPSGVQNV